MTPARAPHDGGVMYAVVVVADAVETATAPYHQQPYAEREPGNSQERDDDAHPRSGVDDTPETLGLSP